MSVKIKIYHSSNQQKNLLVSSEMFEKELSARLWKISCLSRRASLRRLESPLCCVKLSSTSCFKRLLISLRKYSSVSGSIQYFSGPCNQVSCYRLCQHFSVSFLYEMRELQEQSDSFIDDVLHYLICRNFSLKLKLFEFNSFRSFFPRFQSRWLRSFLARFLKGFSSGKNMLELSTRSLAFCSSSNLCSWMIIAISCGTLQPNACSRSHNFENFNGKRWATAWKEIFMRASKSLQKYCENVSTCL